MSTHAIAPAMPHRRGGQLATKRRLSLALSSLLALLLADSDALPDVLDRHLVAEDEPGDPHRSGHLHAGGLVAPRLPRDLRAAELRPVPVQRDGRRACDDRLGRLVAAWSGYGFARYDFRFKPAVMAFVLIAQSFPRILLVIPYFQMANRFGPERHLPGR